MEFLFFIIVFVYTSSFAFTSSNKGKNMRRTTILASLMIFLFIAHYFFPVAENREVVMVSLSVVLILFAVVFISSDLSLWLLADVAYVFLLMGMYERIDLFNNLRYVAIMGAGILVSQVVFTMLIGRRRNIK